jgi:flagellar M-ring protein FliF
VPGVASNVPGSNAAITPAAPPTAPAPGATAPVSGGASPGTLSPGVVSPSIVSPSVFSALDNQSSKSDSSTFAVSKNIRHVLNPAGRVRRITASVLVDDATDTQQENGKPSTVAVRRKRTPEEMKAIEKLARAAIGVDDQRGDLVAVENLSFQTISVETPAPPGRFEKWRLLLLPWMGALRYVGITLLFLLVYALVLRPVKKHAIAAFKQIPGHLAKPLAAGAPGTLATELLPGSDEAARAVSLKKELTEKIKAEPAAAGQLVQSWIHEKKTK